VAAAGEADRCPENVLPSLEITFCGVELCLGGLLGDTDPVLLGL
jgi:hypothetical protein